jgi:hypothetical protein
LEVRYPEEIFMWDVQQILFYLYHIKSRFLLDQLGAHIGRSEDVHMTFLKKLTFQIMFKIHFKQREHMQTEGKRCPANVLRALFSVYYCNVTDGMLKEFYNTNSY